MAWVRDAEEATGLFRQIKLSPRRSPEDQGIYYFLSWGLRLKPHLSSLHVFSEERRGW